MFTDNGLGLAVGVTWCLIAVILTLLACRRKKFRGYGFAAALVALLLGVAFLIDRLEAAFVAAVVAFGQALGAWITAVTAKKR